MTETDNTNLTAAVICGDLEDSSQKTVKKEIDRAAAAGARLIVVPHGFPALSGEELMEWLGAEAARLGVVLVGGVDTADRGRQGVVYGPGGTLLGRSAQTHSLPDEGVALGGELGVIDTPVGKLGVSLGSDLRFPEVHWSLARMGAEILIHLDVPRPPHGHAEMEASLRARAIDTHRPLLVARAVDRLIKLVHNQEMQISGTPMDGSQIIDPNGVIRADTGFAPDMAVARLRAGRSCRSPIEFAALVDAPGTEVYKLNFIDSRKKYFSSLTERFSPTPKPAYEKRRIRLAVIDHFYYADQINGEDEVFLRLMEEACRTKPDLILTTEMEKACRPEDPKVARTVEKAVEVAASVGSYFLIGGYRRHKPGTRQDRSSHGQLWDRSGREVFESVIMLYGKGEGQTTFDTDFGRIGIRLCGDVYAPELDRMFALQGADLVLNPSMSWGASGRVNATLNQARALDNGMFVVSGHLSFSDPHQRSHVIDPTGEVVAASRYFDRSVLQAEIDLDHATAVFVEDGELPPSTDGYLASYRGKVAYRRLHRDELLALRRPEIYRNLDEDLPTDPWVRQGGQASRSVP